MSLSRRIAARYPVLFAMREAVGMGLDAIRAYKMRASLTILGVVMGIMTVTGMSSIIAGLNASMARQIENLGSSVILIRPFQPGENLPEEEWRRRRPISADEAEAISRLTLVRAVSPMEVLRFGLIKSGSQRVRDTTVFGTTPEYEDVHDAYVQRGRFLTQTDVDRGSQVAVLGTDVVDALFPNVDPVDKEVSLDGRRFRVIGVMERKGKFLFMSRDNVIIVPLGSVQRRSERMNFMVADAKPVSAAVLQDAVDQIRAELRRKRKLRYLDSDNFGVATQDTLTDLYRSVTGGIYMVMIAISSIGLLVGGVGVMNIMLVSVTERTREIGVRKALGAKRRDILWQFLTEAMTLTGAGGVLGILIGTLVAWLVNMFSPFPAAIQPTWVTLAFLVAVSTGLFFGLWPAVKAARLDPIEALRYE
jgi:putative ABC transport system permease protein